MGILRTMCAVLLLVVGSSGLSRVWAQTDYTGTWYIASGGKGDNNTYTYNSGNPSNNYYLCPTEGWCFYKATDDFSGDGTTYPNPFLTTYKCRTAGYHSGDPSDAVWTIKKAPAPNAGYYYIIQRSTGRYIVANGIINTTSSGWDRMRVHLEEVANPVDKGNSILFNIYEYSGRIAIQAVGIAEPKDGFHDGHNTHRWLTVNNGNFNNLVGNSGKTGGPTGYQNTAGIVGIYTENDANAPFYLEDAFLKTPTFTINASGNVEISTTETDATIYYTTDGTDPDNSGTRQEYSSPITPTSSMTEIKARVISNKYGVMAKSEIATQPLYTYHIVNLAGEVAIKQTVAQYVGVRLESYLNIPATIRSPYLEGETLTFYSFSGAYNSANLVPGNEITETPTSSANIYVTYTNTHLMGKFLHLRAKRTFNLTINGEYIYDNSGTLAHNASPSDAEKETDAYLWKIGKSGAEDPYAVLIMNKDTENYFHYTTTPSLTFSLNDAASSKFILLSGSAAGDGSDYEQMELMAATGDDNYYRIGRTGDAFSISTTATGAASLQVRAYPIGAGVNYYLIDKAGKLIKIISSKSTALSLPEAWKSPLVDDEDYHYFPVPGYDEGTDTYTPSGTIEGEIDPDVNPNIYVTYDVNDNVAFYDPSSGDPGTTYMLKFYNGESFRQENGADGVMGTAQKAVYPYSNGDAMLYVYGQEQWNTQLASGASTRSRWLWYVESPTNDPYHVKIRSYSGQVSSNNYFRTYVVNYGGSNHVVTGVTTMNAAVSDPESANYQPPTEYMVLKTDNGRCKLVTVNEINDGTTTEHRTVTSLEQYWKNNPTVQNVLGGSKVTVTESYSSDIVLNADQLDHLPNYLHTYKAFANAAPWVGWVTDNTGTSKQYLNKNHWFQTIDMGSTGEFTFEATTLEPQVILLDQHGWEIMRTPLSELATLRKYNSPMVETYHWYPTATKAAGYHKYTVGDPEIKVFTSAVNEQGRTVWYDSGERYTHTSSSLDDSPYDHMPEQGASVKTDFYVTYDVLPLYNRLYTGAATVGATSASPVVLKQGDKYAKIDGTSLSTEGSVSTDFESISANLQWYMKPNFNIDAEMGYKYLGESGAQEDALSKSATEAAYFAAGQNGFDPYNVQIQSVGSPSYYFTANTTGSHLTGGAWAGTSSTLTLESITTHQTPEGYDQSTLKITNATFMVVDDGSGHMQLMPRFDNTSVVNSFTGTHITPVASASNYLSFTIAPVVVRSSTEITLMSGNYILASDFTLVESIGSAGLPFTGSIDGNYHTISGFTKPLLAYATDAVVKNLILSDVAITTDGNAGAIAVNADGNTRIYNCGILSGSVSGDDYVGGLVGLLDGSARVINCYSYANVGGGTDVGGIVGYNNYASDAAHIRTMVMNCMFYGDITSGSNISPVYGGQMIDNRHDGLNTYTYYAYDELTTSAITKYNNSLTIERKYLQRFEIYRQLLNSNRRLAAYYASSPNGTVYADAMMKWVLETADRTIDSPKPYPILKVQGYYPSIINIDAENAPDSVSVGRNHGGKLGKTLSVTMQNSTSGGQTAPADANISTTITLQRTDKDEDRYNYNYDKVQLPYYNDYGTKNYTGNRVVTGWKIVAINSIAGDTYTSSNYDYSQIYSSNPDYFDYPNYNFADRKSSQKDLYSVSGRVFSQGAYFDVPYGVTSITIEPYWGKAAYVSDEYLDVVYNSNYELPKAGAGVTQLGKQFPTAKITIDGSEQTVHTSISAALGTLSSGVSVYDNAVVLVGNLHQGSVPSGGDKAFTMMSVDLDHDNEPDYSMIYHHNTRATLAPLRFDFLNIPGTAQAQKPYNTGTILNAAIFRTKGWFEITNTAFIYFTQYEYENTGTSSDPTTITKTAAPLILLGGYIDQFVSAQSAPILGKTIYIHVGSNVLINSFGLGTHGDGSKATPHVPVSVTGGDYNEFYLSGTYNANANISDDNAECYISSGRFGELAGAAQEQIGSKNSASHGHVHWQIYNADITDFYGGGVNDAKPVQGNITTDIFNSYVTTFCGGPKFGNMAPNRTVTTTAEGCTFGKFFGAGYGGNSYSRKKYFDSNTGVNWSTLQNYYTTDKGKYFDGATTNSKGGGGTDTQYGKKGPGVATDFDYDLFVWTSGKTGGRFYVKFASFSLAQCNDVTSTLTKCTINDSFYGGGSLGQVTGKATSVLDDCTVNGNVFGGGYSAEIPTIPVRTAGFTTYPNINTNSGMFEPGVLSTTTNYEWKQVENLPADGGVGTEAGQYVYTNVNLNELGKVGETDLTITGNTHVTGNVFGGGDQSAISAENGATGNTKVTIEKNVGERVPTISYVYGGGNTADVDGNTEVEMTGGTVSQDIYGGGKGETTLVGGNVTVNIGTKTGVSAPYTYTGNGTITGNVYGGSAKGAVNTTPNESSVYDKTTNVNIYSGTVNGNVFGGGLGVAPTVEPASPGIAAVNFGNTYVTVENSNNANAVVETAVYGGSNANGVLKQNATVTITGGTVGTAPGVGDPITNAVFGGGFGQPTLVEGNVTVDIGTSGQAAPGATINGHVYGGGALGCVNASRPVSDLVFDDTKTTTVNLYQGLINGDAYGGGLGDVGTAAYVGGDVFVTLDGVRMTGSIFGCNNINGTPKGHVKVWVKRTVNIDNEKNALKSNDATPLADRTTYDLLSVYGGGNKADYRPTDAELTLDDSDPAYDPENPGKVKAAKAEVLIDGCNLTSIEYVYGGGNAAAVPADSVTIRECYIIHQVFGGGNGAGVGNPGADVGIYDRTAYAANPATGIYGTGLAKTCLIGGQIHEVYGGSNTKGNVRGGTSVERKKSNDCELKIGEIYGAGQYAPMDGDVNIILECMPESFVDAVFGGAKNAVINGNVSLTVTSGKFGRVFGGNNEGGSINGSITVNAYEEGCEPLIIGELYGGGYNAPYSIYGCNDSDGDGTWTPNAEEGDPYIVQDAEYPAIGVYVYSCTSIGKVFGGGYGATADVVGNTRVWINLQKGHVNEVEQLNIGKIGQVFGGGNAASVKGDVSLEIGTVSSALLALGVNITRGTYTDAEHGTYLSPTSDAYIDITEPGIYGGGYSADVNGSTTLQIGTAEQSLGTTIAGNIFGGGYGEKTTVKDNVVVNIGKRTVTDPEGPVYAYEGYAEITGDVYGGSAKGKVNATKGGTVESPTFTPSAGTTQLNLYGGTITGNLYGGGLGEDNVGTENDHAADVYGPVTVNVEGGKVVNVFGCNNVLGSPQSTATVNIHGMDAPEAPATYRIANVYGGGNQAAYTGDSGVSVIMTNGWVNDVFGGGLGTTATVNGSTAVTLTGGTVTNDVYGGGSQGDVTGAVSVTLNGGTVERDVYGGGALAETNTEYHSTEHPTYVTNVTLGGGTITGNLYGGGLGQYSDDGDASNDVAADVNGPVTVAVTNGSTANVFGCNNVYGMPKSTVDVKIGTKTGASAPYTYGGTGAISGSVYGGGNQAACTGSPIVYIYGGTVDTNVYGGGLGATAVTGGATVIMEDGTVSNDVFGGGSLADVTGSVSVTISGGTVVNDVYGGGALANTNTENWDPAANGGTGGWNVASSADTDYYIPVKHLTKDVSVVTGYYTVANDPSSIISTPDTKAAESTTYYKKITLPANIYAIATTGTTYTTSVTATGGVIGNIYGGGLGQLGVSPIAAMVYGDVTVTVNGAAFTNELVSYNYTAEEAIAYNAGLTGALNTTDPLTADQATTYNAVIRPETAKVAGDILSAEEAAAYNARLSGAVSTSDTKNVAKTGRVFGCNNLNGTPKGNVLVQVNQTTRQDGGAHVDDDFEILAVYGGGNAADYEPQTYDFTTEFGQHPRVVIDGCTEVSIEKVYGGGNAAAVPFTDVLIEGAYQIGYVFGGGNGGDRLYYNDSWHENLGANVTGYANVLLRGGTIGQYFGGSDTRGSVGGTETREEDGGCDLHIVNFYGAGNGEQAETLGDITINVSGCGSNINKVFGGSYKANVKGSITLNIKSGVFTSVYGGNDRMGSVGGNITVNIEETDDCGTPIIIQNLFGGCYETPYPGASASTYIGPATPTDEDKANPANYTPFTSGKITVNVKSATRIDKVYGGSYKAGVNGDTEVNINMTHGSCAGQPYELPAGYRGNPIPNIHGVPVYREVTGLTYLPSESASSVDGYYTYDGEKYTQINDEDAKAEEGTDYYEIERLQGTIDDAIGTIGYVFGGGYQGVVNGDAVVNVGTETEVDYATTVTHLTPNAHDKYDVRGAHIEHDVFGGGNLADIMGSTEVNICAKDGDPVAEGAEKVTIGGSACGGGNQGDIKENTHITMSGGYVFNGVFGGGYYGSVGTFTTSTDPEHANIYGHTSHAGCIGKPISCAANTGKCTVLVNGGQIGPVTVATVGMDPTNSHGGPVPQGWVWGGGYGLIEDPAEHPDTHFKTYVNETDVTIGGTAFVMEGIIGGGEFGRVLHDTKVTIEGNCQIGVGENQTEAGGSLPKRYSDALWTEAATAITSGTDADIATVAAKMPECSHFEYGHDWDGDGKLDYLPYDPYYDEFSSPAEFSPASTAHPSDGKTWIGVVFGGGSGYMPYRKADGTGYDWNPSAGLVEGNTTVNITGGHILTNVYGANEYTDVKGKATVTMSGGTIGVPRTLAQIAAHPVSCYLFGAGKGDERAHFNNYNNTGSVEVAVSGGIIYGSVFGGGEDGHVLGNTSVTITGTAKIGTWGTSYVDGNVFGGGRGFSGTTLSAGTIGGNVEVNISGTPTMLGSVYGGGRLASVGVDFTSPQDASTGQFKEDGGGKTYGHVTINISGGTIGNDTESALIATEGHNHDHTKGGNVFGASMGRLTLLDGTTPNPLWTRLAQTKSSTINISGGTIRNSVFGGAEYGTTRDDATITITGGTIDGHVYGGGYGSNIHDAAYNGTIVAGTAPNTNTYRFTPLQYAGCLGGDSYVSVSGGHVKGNVYGGGKLASVGVIDYEIDGSGNYKTVIKHDSHSGADETYYGFGLSWPYEFSYIQGGKTNVSITGSAIVDNYVFGAGKGMVAFGATDDIADQRYTEAHIANVRETEVTIGTEGGEDNPQVRTVYGGGEDGHVIENAKVTIHRGTINRSVFGGGKGDTQFTTYLLDPDHPGDAKATTDNIYSWTAGKVYGNTEVTMNGGSVGWFIYGGGNMASVGKGNYAGGSDDYAPGGYGELPSADGPLWTNTDFTESGNTKVTILGGTLGAVDAELGEDGIPRGSVFGGSRGKTAKAEVEYTPRYKYVPSFFLGYVNTTAIKIGGTAPDAVTPGAGPTIYGCIYGGAQDGHVRNSTEVKIFKGSLPGQTGAGADRSGNVFGAGSGIGTYSPDGVNNYCNSASGSVTCTTLVEVRGGSIAGNVYGGGALASVGPPQMGQPANEQKAPSEGHPSHSCNTVEIYGGAIGGSVYGASRGPGDSMFPLPFTGVSTAVDATADKYNPTMFATSLWTVVNVKGGTIAGNVYGGGEMGRVKESTEVHLTGGSIAHDAYGGGKGTLGDYAIAADVGGNTTVKLNEGVLESAKGCVVSKIFGCNDLNGTPKGHVLVHVYATQNSTTADISTKVPDYHPNQGDAEGYKDYLDRMIASAKPGGTVLTGVDADVVTAAETLLTSLSAKDEEAVAADATDVTNIKTCASNIIKELEKIHVYDVAAVYGGGDLAKYESTDLGADGKTTVIIEGCDVTSIRQVYGGGNAAPVPATDVSVASCFLIDELFGGGNGKDNYQQDDKWYGNPGANVGYYTFDHYDKGGSHGDGLTEGTKYVAITNTDPDATTKAGRIANYSYGSGRAVTLVTGGRIHNTYGGSNEKGNIRTEALLQLEESGTCKMVLGETYNGSKNADTDAELNTIADCVEEGGILYGGSKSADVYNDVNIRITNGHYTKIFGGNNKAGTIRGKITITIEEHGCTPIEIDELYAGGYLAPYSIYGYEDEAVDATDKEGNPIYDDDGETRLKQKMPLKSGDVGARPTPWRNPHIEVISATRIGKIFGGGYNADVIGSPHINVNMTEGRIRAKFADKDPSYALLEEDEDHNLILPIGSIGDIFGGGNMADIIGNTSVEIGTGKMHDEDDVTALTLDPARNAATITGNVYGGGKMGHVGDFTLDGSGKPTSCAAGTGICRVYIGNGEIGPDNMAMFHLNGSGNIPTDDAPDNAGHVFGGGQGTNLPADDNVAYVDSAEVIINGATWVKGSVFGGGENGHVLHNAGVKISGNCQIGNGHILLTDGSGNILVNQGLNRPYTATEWEQGKLILTGSDLPGVSSANKELIAAEYEHSLPECDSWLFGKEVQGNRVVTSEHHSPYDCLANATGNLNEYPTTPDGEETNSTLGGRKVATSGRAFNGSVYGGGSGYFPYAVGKWNTNAGKVFGNTWVEVTGGHILTSLYGGNEMTSVGGDTHVKMTGGTLGVPRTLSQITTHPVTCYVFGGGKGEGRRFLDNVTTVGGDAYVTISDNARIYGSVFGGAEDGWVEGDVHLNIKSGKDSTVYVNPTVGTKSMRFPLIGTWGTSYVDGNIFGGGRGYDGINTLAGRIGGNVNVDISDGTMLGSIFGGGRMGSVGIGTTVDGEGRATLRSGDSYGVITVNITGGTIGNDLEYQYVDADNYATLTNASTGDLRLTEFDAAASFTNKIKDEDGLITEAGSATTIRRLSHTKGGNVFAGCMGRLTKMDGTTINDNWDHLGLAKRTVVNISGANTRIKGNVYGGGEFGAVMDFEHPNANSTTINIAGGTIGTAIMKRYEDVDVPQYYFGSVFGGGYGSSRELTPAEVLEGISDPIERAGLVRGNTVINMSSGTVLGSIFGGGDLAQTDGTTNVTVSGGAIGVNKVRKSDGYVMYGSSQMGNVYGGGKGILANNLTGLVKGNTNINVSGGNIYHMVYGGGALGSVGTFRLAHRNATNTGPLSPDTDLPDIPVGIPLEWSGGTGTATVNITGGTIGNSARDNGLVFGSSRGNLTKPTGSPLRDPYDYVAWVNNSVVNIGTEGEGFDAPQPQIKCSVYGGGENGHNKGNATVNVYSGTIGITNEADPWYSFEDKDLEKRAKSNRGNVYGAGSGADTYSVTVGETKYSYYNPKAGMVAGNTSVNIRGGHVGHNVYGGGATASVGSITNAADTTSVANKHSDKATSFALSWPYNIEFAPSTGKSYVTVTGGRIGIGETGIVGEDNGNIYGGSRGVAGSHFYEAHLANVNETYVTINYAGDTPTSDNGSTTPLIAGSVFGGSEDGHVMGDTHVSMQNGLIKHSLFAGGRGQGVFKRKMKKISDGSDTDVKDSVRSITAGKVYGNTYLEMTGGRVWHNVFGGGYMASVGKGNYSGGSDDYATTGYGETITGKLWESDAEGDNAWHFLNSGKAYLTITGGTIGLVGPDLWDGLPSGCVFGSSRGVSAPNISDMSKVAPEYCPHFFSGYVNETFVTIGGDYKCKKAITKDDIVYIPGRTLSARQAEALFTSAELEESWTPIAGDGPTIYGSVYGGGQDGHVRREAHLIVNKGEIGLPYNSDNQSLLETSDLDSPHWLLRGNVFGAGSGITPFAFDLNDDGDTTDEGETGYSTSAGSVTHFTQVDIYGGTIHRNVYGGGSLASVGPPPVMNPLPYDIRRRDDTSVGIGHRSVCLLNISGTIGSPIDYNEVYGGEVYGASRGNSDLDPTMYSTTLWTQVNIHDGADIKNNVFGGGDAGAVSKNTEVNIGDVAP